MADRISLTITMEMPEARLYPLLRGLRVWETASGDVDFTLQVHSRLSCTTEELTAFMQSLEPPLEDIVVLPHEEC